MIARLGLSSTSRKTEINETDSRFANQKTPPKRLENYLTGGHPIKYIGLWSGGRSFYALWGHLERPDNEIMGIIREFKGEKMMLRGTKQKGFTIVELLTVMSIIIILMSILVPAMSRVRRYAKMVTQKGQFSDISKGLEIYRNEHQEAYPDSGAVDGAGDGYCGAMKLCEALLGQDGMGYHPSSSFLADPTLGGTIPDIYLFDLCLTRDPGVLPYQPAEITNLQERIKYVDPENIKPYRLQDIYPWAITTGASFYNPGITFKNAVPTYSNAVIGDVFQRASIQGGALGCPARAGQKAGMPVLYYKADPSKLNHDTITTPNPANPNINIYNFDDNYAITALGCPWEQVRTTEHPMSLPPVLPQTPGILLFYREITNAKITSTPRPHNEDSYILISAGWDGLYGTKDDVFNFAD